MSSKAILIKLGSAEHSGGNVYGDRQSAKTNENKGGKKIRKKRTSSGGWQFFAPNAGYKRSLCANPKNWILV